MGGKDTRARENVLRYITENPGCNYEAICIHNGITKTLCNRILAEFEELDKVQHIPSGGHIRYYPTEIDGKKVSLKVKAVPNVFGTPGSLRDTTYVEMEVEEPPEPETKEPVDLESLFSGLDALKGIHTGTSADDHIRLAVEEMEKLLEDAVSSCPFCGGKSRLCCTSGKYRIECTCGALFAYSPGTESASATVKAFNRRAGQ